MKKLLKDINPFAETIYEILRIVPEAKVVTYGQLAELSGHPGAARAVGNALHVNPDPDGTPCFRVVTSHGKLSSSFAFGGMYEHRRRLEEDGIEVINFKVSLSEYQWHPSEEELNKIEREILHCD